MSTDKNIRVCPMERAAGLENSLRKLVQNPKKILKSYINEGMIILDLGCGPGFFTVEMAKMLKHSGKIIAADLQEGMLEKVRQKIKGTALEKRIECHICQTEQIGVAEKIDFVLAFYMIHEAPNQDKLFSELKSILKPNGKIFVAEPNFHVSKKSFDLMVNKGKSVGLKPIEGPKLFFSRTVVLQNT